MNIEELFAERCSRAEIENAIQYVGNSQSRFAIVFEQLKSVDEQRKKNASWVIKHLVQKHHEFILSYLDDLIIIIQNNLSNETVLRNCLWIFSDFVDIKEKYVEDLVNISYPLIENKRTPSAIQAAALTVLEKALDFYPELANELKTIVEDQMDNAKPAFRYRGKKLLKRISRFS